MKSSPGKTFMTPDTKDVPKFSDREPIDEIKEIKRRLDILEDKRIAEGFK